MTEYQALLEATLAHAIKERAVIGVSMRDTHDAFVTGLYRGEVHGLCMALRLTGGYGTTAFGLEWANDPARPSVDWEKALDAAYADGIQRIA